MQRLSFILFALVLCLNCFAQSQDSRNGLLLREQKKVKFFHRNDVKMIGLFTASIILNGIGDGMNDSDRKGIGHLYNAASIGTLLCSPFLVRVEKKRFLYYLASYTFIRYGIFDGVYNMTRGLPMGYCGTASYTDKLLGKANPTLVTSTRILSFAIGIYIPIKYF